MSQTLEELEQTIREAQDKIQEIKEAQRVQQEADSIEYELRQEEELRQALEEDERLEAEAQEIYDNEVVETKGEYTGERIAASVKEMVKDIPEPKIKGKADFTLKLRDNRVLFNVVSQIAGLCEEATFEVTSEGLSFRGMDPSHVALIDVSIPNSCFEVFEIDPEDSAKFGVRIEELLALFKKFDKKDREVTLSMGYDSMLTIKSGFFNAKVRLIESSATSVPLPKLNFNAKLDISIETLKQINSFIDGLDYLTLESTHNKLELSSKADTGDYKTTINEIDDYNYGTNNFEVKEDSKAMYSIDYLKKFIRTYLRDAKAVLGETLTFEYSSKMPLRMSYNVLGYGKMHYYLAPRVQD